MCWQAWRSRGNEFLAIAGLLIVLMINNLHTNELMYWGKPEEGANLVAMGVAHVILGVLHIAGLKRYALYSKLIKSK